MIAALVSGSTYAEAGAASGTSAATVKRRLADPDFRAGLDAERSTILRRVADALTVASLAAVETLLAVMTDEEMPTAARVSAAARILSAGSAYREQVELFARLAALEATIRAQPTRA